MSFIQFGGEYRPRNDLRVSTVVGALGLGVAAVFFFKHGRSLVHHHVGRREAEKFFGDGRDDDTVILRAPGEPMTILMARKLAR